MSNKLFIKSLEKLLHNEGKLPISSSPINGPLPNKNEIANIDGCLMWNGAIRLPNIVLPNIKTDKLYNIGGTLYWNEKDLSTPLTGTKGNLIIGNGTNAIDFGIGNIGEVLTVDPTSETGVTWSLSSADGEINTGYNIGITGFSIFKEKNGTILEFKKLTANSGKIRITENILNNEIDIDTNININDYLPTNNKGDILVQTNSGIEKLDLGNNGNLLIVDSNIDNGITWGNTIENDMKLIGNLETNGNVSINVTGIHFNDSTGNVGIGTVDGTSKLTIIGDILIDGNISNVNKIFVNDNKTVFNHNWIPYLNSNYGTTSTIPIFLAEYISGNTGLRTHFIVKYSITHRKTTSLFNTGSIRGIITGIIGSPDGFTTNLRIDQLHDQRTDDKGLYNGTIFNNEISVVFKTSTINNQIQLCAEIINQGSDSTYDRNITSNFNIEFGAEIVDNNLKITLQNHNDNILVGDTNTTAENNVILTTNGNIGINTTNPLIKLAIEEENTGINHPTTDVITIETSGTERIRFNSNGNIGIGITNPSSILHLKQKNDDDGGNLNSYDSSAIIIERNSNENKWAIGQTELNFLSFWFNTTEKAYLTNNISVGEIDFTGQHRNKMENNNNEIIKNIKNYIGLIVSATGNYVSGVNINESLPYVELSSTDNDKKVFGVISDAENIDTNNRIYTQGAFVSVIEKDTNDARIIINSLGEGGIWVCNINGPFQNGDYITTTNIAKGYGVKQNSEFLANYTVAKITCDEDFSDMSNPENSRILIDGIKCKFVGCTYHCG